MEKKKSTRLELDNWKKLKNLATNKESTVEIELNKIIKKELGDSGE